MQKARLILGFLASLSIAAGANAYAADADKLNQLTKEEKRAGWKLLFDGTTLKGWRGYKKPDATDSWKVEDGAITRVGKGDLVTTEEYQDFELSIDWTIVPRGNSGIMYHVAEGAGAPYETGPEMQVTDNVGHPDGKNPLTAAGSCYALYPATKDVTKPAGSWNSAKIIVNKGHVEHWLNGEKIVEYTLGSDDWNAKVAASKFGKMPEFGKPAKGFIDLQDHGDKVSFRNIKIRVPSDKAAGSKKAAKK